MKYYNLIPQISKYKPNTIKCTLHWNIKMFLNHIYPKLNLM